MRMPLHIFEPRYRQLLLDCLSADRTFGLVYREESAELPLIEPGRVGCRAFIDDVEPLAGGRANIVVTGGDRFTLIRHVADESPYDVAEVEPFDDEEEPVAQLTALASRLGELFVDVATAARTLADDGSPPPSLPDDPGSIAFVAATSIQMPPADLQLLLESASPSDRMRQMIMMFDSSLPTLMARAEAHAGASRNGRGPRANP